VLWLKRLVFIIVLSSLINRDVRAWPWTGHGFKAGIFDLGLALKPTAPTALALALQTKARPWL